MSPDFTSCLFDLQNFLLPWQKVIGREVLESYPQHRELFPLPWLEALKKLSDHELFLWEAKNQIPAQLPADFLLFLQEIHRLCQLPQMPLLPHQMDSHAFIKIKEKKRHELEALIPYLAQWKEEHHIEQVIDVGGGLGHLSHCLAKYYGAQVLCLDQDQVLQEKGRKKQKRLGLSGLTYAHYVGERNQIDRSGLSALAAHLSPRHKMCLGLHTCGDLAPVQLELGKSTECELIVHFGCCYHKLSAPYKLSSHQHPLELNLFALTLAAKSYQRFDLEDFLFKLKVKNYRYLFHLYLTEELGLKDFLPLGPSPRELYLKDFPTYVQEQCRRLKLAAPSDSQCQLFMSHPLHQESVRELILLGILRGQLGRLIELVLLTDRALYLEQAGYRVFMGQFFERSLSPRNIAVVGRKSH